MKFFKYYFPSFIVVFVLVSCQNDKKIPTTDSKNEEVVKNGLSFISPQNGNTYTCNQILNITFNITDTTALPDSIRVYVNSKPFVVLPKGQLSTSFNTKSEKVGQLRISADAFYLKSVQSSSAIAIVLLSDIEPTMYSYKIVNTFKHDAGAYTQGLIYENGFFYESTGQYGQSTLRKVKVQTGEVVDMVTLDDNIFAEGIAIAGNKIFQVTYREQVCFVYDKTTFKRIGQFNYDLGQGWGLEYNGKNILMTTGGNTIYYINKENFSTENTLDVADDKELVDSLNELEIINGKIFANVYQKDYVVIIDPSTGKVVGKIDFTGLLKDSDKKPSTDVLNGIAWNPQNGHLYITGKDWPKLFEIELLNYK
jgi:glutamine cyclotransferase